MTETIQPLQVDGPSNDAVETTLAYFAALSAKDIDGVEQVLADDVVHITPSRTREALSLSCTSSARKRCSGTPDRSRTATRA